MKEETNPISSSKNSRNCKENFRGLWLAAQKRLQTLIETANSVQRHKKPLLTYSRVLVFINALYTVKADVIHVALTPHLKYILADSGSPSVSGLLNRAFFELTASIPTGLARNHVDDSVVEMRVALTKIHRDKYKMTVYNKEDEQENSSSLQRMYRYNSQDQQQSPQELSNDNNDKVQNQRPYSS